MGQLTYALTALSGVGIVAACGERKVDVFSTVEDNVAPRATSGDVLNDDFEGENRKILVSDGYWYPINDGMGQQKLYR